MELKVCDLLGDDGKWDLEILSHQFLDIDVNDFQSIHVVTLREKILKCGILMQKVNIMCVWGIG